MQTDRIRARAKECGRSLSYLCRALGVAPVYFIDIEKQNRTIPPEKMAIIAEELNTSAAYLAYETDDPAPKEKDPIQVLDEVEMRVVEILRGMSIEEKLELIEWLEKNAK